ncbi:MAG: hypothetical protein V4727_01660 [Verrucomicrobiota bacterium]
MSPLKLLIPTFICVIMAGMTSCGSLGNTGYLYQTAADAHDHIMMVRESPPTFGYERLRALSQYYPHLAVFIESQGQPRYYAETTSGGGRYLILYYPEKRQAFACRTGAKLSHQIEFSGPYPITKNELATLQMLEDE